MPKERPLSSEERATIPAPPPVSPPDIIFDEPDFVEYRPVSTKYDERGYTEVSLEDRRARMARELEREETVRRFEEDEKMKKIRAQLGRVHRQVNGMARELSDTAPETWREPTQQDVLFTDLPSKIGPKKYVDPYNPYAGWALKHRIPESHVPGLIGAKNWSGKPFPLRTEEAQRGESEVVEERLIFSDSHQPTLRSPDNPFVSASDRSLPVQGSGVREREFADDDESGPVSRRGADVGRMGFGA